MGKKTGKQVVRRTLGLLLVLVLIAGMLPVMQKTSKANEGDNIYDSIRVIPDYWGEKVDVWLYKDKTNQGRLLDPSEYTLELKDADGKKVSSIKDIHTVHGTVKATLNNPPRADLKEAGPVDVYTGLYHVYTGFDTNGNANSACYKINMVEVLPYAHTVLAYDYCGSLLSPHNIKGVFERKVSNGNYIDCPEDEPWWDTPGIYRVSIYPINGLEHARQAIDSNYLIWTTIDENKGATVRSDNLADGSITVDPFTKTVVVKRNTGEVVPAENYDLVYYEGYNGRPRKEAKKARQRKAGNRPSKEFPTSQGTYYAIASAKEDNTGGYTGRIVSDSFVIGEGRYAAIDVDTDKKTVTVKDKDKKIIPASEYDVNYWRQGEDTGNSFPTAPGIYTALAKNKNSAEASMIESLPFTIPVDKAKHTASLDEVSLSAVQTDEKGKYVDAEVTFTAEGNLAESENRENIQFHEGFVGASCAAGEAMLIYNATLMEKEEGQTPQDGYPSYTYNSTYKIGKAKFQVRVLQKAADQEIKYDSGYGTDLLNGVVDGDTLKFQLETVLQNGTIAKSNVAEVKLKLSELPKKYIIPKVSKLTIDKVKASVRKGATLKLKATQGDKDVTSSVKWSSDKTSVATVNEGTVTGVSKGTATITAEASDGTKATCEVTVTESSTPSGGGGSSTGGSTPVASSAPTASAAPTATTAPSTAVTPTTAPTTVTNDDGSTTTTTVTTDTEGTKTESVTTKTDGSTEKTTEVVKTDGSTEKTTETVKTDGSTEKTTETVKTNGSTEKTKDVTNADGSTLHEEVKVNAKGKETTYAVETTATGDKTVTESEVKASGDYSKTTTETKVKTDKDGNVTGEVTTIQTETKSKKVVETTTFEVKDPDKKTLTLTSATTTAKSGTVVIPKTVKSDGTTYKVSILSAGMLDGNGKKPGKVKLDASNIKKVEEGALDGMAKNGTIVITSRTKTSFNKLKKKLENSGLPKGTKIKWNQKD